MCKIGNDTSFYFRCWTSYASSHHLEWWWWWCTFRIDKELINCDGKLDFSIWKKSNQIKHQKLIILILSLLLIHVIKVIRVSGINIAHMRDYHQSTTSPSSWFYITRSRWCIHHRTIFRSSYNRIILSITCYISYWWWWWWWWWWIITITSITWVIRRCYHRIG